MSSEIHNLQRALHLQKQGKLEDAEAIYRDVLARDPRQVDAKHLLGLIAQQRGDYELAIQMISMAVEEAPHSAVFVGNLGVAYRQAGRIPEAIEAYRRAIELDPENSELYFNLGKALKLQGDFVAAEEAFRRSIELDGAYVSPRLSLMSLFADNHELEKAKSVGELALRACAPSIEIWLSLGAIYRRLNANEQARVCYEHALGINPRHVETLTRLASLHFMSFRFPEGKVFLDRAAQLDAESVHVINATGLMNKMRGDTDAAVEDYKKSIKIYPQFTTAFSNLAGVQRKQGEFTEALANVRAALRIAPQNVESLAVEGSVLVSLGQLDEAECRFRQAIQLRKGYCEAHDNLLMCLQYQPRSTLASLFSEHSRWDEQYAAGLFSGRSFPLKSEQPQLRLGFVSGDLGLHPVGFFTARLFDAIDRTAFKTLVYSDRLGRDCLAARIEKCVDRWVDTASLDDDALEKLILGDQIDILFDLSGHTSQNRLLVFARRVAPIQITWAGYVGTTGLSQMDYVLADGYHIPSQFDSFYRERVLRMPSGYVTYTAPEGTPAIRDLPAARNGNVTFAAMCNPAKVNSQVLNLWARILMQVPGSRLRLCYPGWTDPGNRSRVDEQLATAGCPGRVEFEQRHGAVAVMDAYNDVDIALDTFPYSGGLTTCEAMWMGVPTITCPGERFASRHSLSHLSVVGMTNCISTGGDDYVSRAVALARDLPRLAEMRSSLRNRMLASPLCDGAAFARDFAQLMRQIWRARADMLSE